MPEKKGWNLEVLKEVIQIMKDEDLAEVCLEQGGMKIKIKRPFAQSLTALQGATILSSQEQTKYSNISEDISEDVVIIPAPMVGTFYRSSSPDAEPFANVGDLIESGQVICIIEAMKLMNEITADIDGKIMEILIEDGQPVEYDQPMFRIKPLR
jgi:acetyl-CoA carboxylase biotin carboxyl carrier protein